VNEVIRVYLEDHGQDFLVWDIKDGVVVESYPYQGWLWNGTKIINEEFGPGDQLIIQRPNSVVMMLNYPVEKIEYIPDVEKASV